MEVETPPHATAAAVLKRLGVGRGAEPGLEATGDKVSRSPTGVGVAATEPPQQPEGEATPATYRGRPAEEEEETPHRGFAAARARRKAGGATPSPSRKLEASPPPWTDAEEAVAGRRGAPAASARKLGATLWEIQDVVRVAGAGRRIRRRGRRSPTGNDAGADVDADRPRSSVNHGAHHAASLEHDKLHEERCQSRQPLSSESYTSSVGASTIKLVSPTRSLDFNARSRQAGYDLKTSTELLRVLNRIWSLEEQRAADISAMKGLKRELQHALACIQELMQERQRYSHDVDTLARQIAEDKMARRNKEQEKMMASLHSLQEELEDEKHLRKHSESLHRKLVKELSEMKSAFSKVVKDLEKEKKATCLLEDLCDEFAKGIKNYEDEVRVLQQKRLKKYGHKFDKSIVHFSEAWLDERMQMQNADVRNDSAGRISITERLSSEIQSFLHCAKRSGNSKNDNLHVVNEKRDASLCRQSLESVPLHGATSAPRLAEDDDGSSVASDLHCFELNMHGNAIRNHELAGTHRRITSCMHSPMRRLQYSNRVSVEGSPMSNAPPCSKKDKTRSSIGRQQFIVSTREIDLHDSAAIAPLEEQNETVTTQVSRRLRDDLLKIKTEAPQHAYLGQNLNYPWRNQLCEYTTSRDLRDVNGPKRQLSNEISESPSHQVQRTKENTLKEKLLQARLEGQHARLSASAYPLISTRRK